MVTDLQFIGRLFECLCVGEGVARGEGGKEKEVKDCALGKCKRFV